jgi:hypothetical protein
VAPSSSPSSSPVVVVCGINENYKEGEVELVSESTMLEKFNGL